MIFIDAMIPMYLVGRDARKRVVAETAVAQIIETRTTALTSAEVFQELLHRYVVIRRMDIVQGAFDALRGIVDEVLPVTETDVMAAKDIALGRHGLSARDAVHAAVMKRHGVSKILTFDHGFDQLPWITRLPL